MEETWIGYWHKEKKPPTIGHFNKSLHGKQYVQGNDLWIRAKLLVSQNLEHKAEGLYKPTVMFFGLCNSPATFQAMMNGIFRDIVDEGWIVIYMDVILIASETAKLDKEQTRRVLQ